MKKFLIMIVLVVAVFMATINGKDEFYLKNQNLYYGNDVLIENVVDYKLSCKMQLSETDL